MLLICCFTLQVFAGLLHGTQPVAIKVLYSAGDAHLTHQFWREAAILQRCRHPNIVQIYGVFSGLDESICANGAGGEMRLLLTPGSRRLMVVMELLEGGSLLQLMSRPDMRWNQRCVVSHDLVFPRAEVQHHPPARLSDCCRGGRVALDVARALA